MPRVLDWTPLNHSLLQQCCEHSTYITNESYCGCEYPIVEQWQLILQLDRFTEYSVCVCTLYHNKTACHDQFISKTESCNTKVEFIALLLCYIAACISCPPPPPLPLPHTSRATLPVSTAVKRCGMPSRQST